MSRLIKTIIVEDEPPARMKLASFIKRKDSMLLAETFINAESALKYIEKNNVDLIFLDICMDGMSGIDFLESVVNPPMVIITSAYQEYAIKGYEYNVCDYLLKPYSFERFEKAVDKAANVLCLDAKREKDDKAYILVKTEYKMEKIYLDDIIYIEGMKDYLRIHTKTRKIMTLRTFSSMENELNDYSFVRIHRSFIVPIKKINAVLKDSVIINNIELPIGRSFKQIFLEKVNKGSI
ncbi:MAG: response regulator transcription factor [Bacteroidales bacterium]|nr:response regulator transcription factor [Bacteroidales bacterium]